MFYSQFILAKKGPLGTIWIAAHLERKLRKNQVADTDIGFSVDSIIFPEVPIALRLSSHLLLGVVRIYSRKVNYLFDDCSEALLKIKQAFRSAAVDLPPEESSAPYHSITLPETFDLDDFELPDSEIFQGNYVDHHISAKEQITLQDTMDGVVYSTSQFGLDERFGDGDTCQIGLDINEVEILDIKPESQCLNGIDGTSMCIDGQTKTQDVEKLEPEPDENAAPSACSPVSLELEKHNPAVADVAVEKEDSPKKSTEDACCQLESHHLPGVADGLEIDDELKDPETSSDLKKDTQSKFMKGLQSRNSNISHQEKSLLEGDEQCLAADVITVNENQTLEPDLNGKVQAGVGELLDQFYNEALKNQSGKDNSIVNLDLPAPEKLLSVPEFSADKPNGLLEESTPNKEVLEQEIKQISGRKRTLTESAATMQSKSLESFGLSGSKQTVESIPDDDDLLSSILVGRSSILKMRPTPVPLEVISSKRRRTGQRASALKRKVLMDETMVLLGDMIRQQLMSTEDLRRMRKKAPCTLSEIAMIQRQSLEDEIFSGPTLAGLTAELFFMHRKTYDVSRTKIYEFNKVAVPAEATKESSVWSDVPGQSEKGVTNGLLVTRDDGGVQAAETLAQDQKHHDEECAPDPLTTESMVLVDTIEMDKGRVEGADALSQPVVSELDMQVSADLIHENRCNGPDNLASGEDLMEKAGDDVAPNLSPWHTFNNQSLGKDSSLDNVLTEVGAVSELCLNKLVSEAGPHSRICHSVDAETNFPMEDCILPKDHRDISSGIALAAVEEHDNLMLVENDEDAERLENMAALSKVDIGSSSLLKDDFGHSVEDEGNTNYTSLIEDEAVLLCEDLGLEGREMEAIDGHDDLENTATGNDTGFLNVDDDEVDEDNEHLSDVEDSQLLDNSGWSSRTRAVAKFLQTLFNKEAVHGKSVLPMDSLLAGKTRREASRMFFESLVLKTRDYVQVEQVKPFDIINMWPQAKLMKSHF